jgi:hypothetical protein
VPKLYWESQPACTAAVCPTARSSEKEYDDYARDLVNYMVYMGEPAQLQRKQIGYIVLDFLAGRNVAVGLFPEKRILERHPLISTAQIKGKTTRFCLFYVQTAWLCRQTDFLKK